MSDKKTDKRKVTSKTNMEKARQAKLEQLKKKKEDKNNTKEYEIYDSDSASSSDSDTETDDEVIIVKGKKRNNKTQMSEIEKLNAEIVELKKMVHKEKSKNNKAKKQVIKVVNQQPSRPSDPKVNGLKERILVNF